MFAAKEGQAQRKAGTLEKMKTLDTTLRDGLQGVGLSLSTGERLLLAREIAGSGIDFIEAGFPQAGGQTKDFLELLEREPFAGQVFLFGSTRKKGEEAKNSAALTPLLSSPFPGAVIVGKTWPLHLDEVLGVSKDENLAMIRESVATLLEAGKRVIYDAEHFFDGWRADADYALLCLEAAAGAEWITLCDTNGASLPEDIMEATREAKTLGLPLGIHCHDDCGLAVAGSLAAARAGAGLVQGTVNGVGERCGNANLISVICDLQLKMGADVVSKEQLETMTALSRRADELLGIPPNPKQPFVGEHAFTHKGGMHAAGMERSRETFEHIDPRTVGNSSSVSVSELAGQSSLRQKAEELGLVLDAKQVAGKLGKIKNKEGQGYLYEGAEASLYLLLSEERLFTVESFESSSNNKGSAASITLRAGRKSRTAKAQGKGPVEAADKAMRKALAKTYPQIADVSLTDYKVHIIDTALAAGATTRVFLEAGRGNKRWTAVGVSGNIIEASIEALEDSYNFALVQIKA